MEEKNIPLIHTNIRLNYTKKFILVFISFVLVFFSGIRAAEAASLYLSPSTGSYDVGQNLAVNIYVSSADQAMNAASGVVSFPPSNLELLSLSKSGSIMSLWVQEPSFSNSAGTLNFEGIVLNPGFTGASGKIITANFRVKAGGTALLNFLSGSVLANDGKGTNILTNLGSATFSLGGAAPSLPETTTPSGIAGLPIAPQISSPTHPDSNKWYSNKSPKLSWSLPSDVTAVRLLVGKIPNAIPTITYTPPISSKELGNLDNGVWYFHVRFKNSAGWGDVTHFRIQIDTEPPLPFVIKFADGKETDNPRPTTFFDTTDSLSGIDYYKVKIGEGDFFLSSSEVVKSNPYTLPLQAPGKRTILVQAYDKADNLSTASEEFIIKPIDSPILINIPGELASNEILKIGGKTRYSNGEVVIWFQKENEPPKRQAVKPDDKGNFTAVLDERVSNGIYRIWAEAIDERGARSLPSEEVIVAVKPAFQQIGSWAVSVLAIVVPLVALVILLLFIGWYGWQRFRRLRNKVKKEVGRIEQMVHKAFDALREDVREGINTLEKTRNKRQLTEEEEKMLKHLKRSLDNTENIIKAEIEEIGKEVK